MADWPFYMVLLINGIFICCVQKFLDDMWELRITIIILGTIEIGLGVLGLLGVL